MSTICLAWYCEQLISTIINTVEPAYLKLG